MSRNYDDYYQDYDQECDVNDTDCNSVYYDYYSFATDVVLPEGYIIPVVFGLIFIVGIVGNSLVVYVVIRNGTMKTNTNLYLVNLAVGDLLFLTFCVPFTAWLYLPPNWIFGDFMCKLTNYLIVVTMSVSIMTLTCMGIDRYHAVVHPVKSRLTRTRARTIVCLVVIWISSLIILFPITLITMVEKHFDYGGEQTFCLEKWPSTQQRKVYTILAFVLLYLLPLAIIAVSYLKMARNLWSSIGPEANVSERRLMNRRKVAKLVLTVVIVFGVCHLPIHMVTIWAEFGQITEASAIYLHVLKLIAHCSLYAHSCLNPIVYGFLSENFRKSFKFAFLMCAKKVVPAKVFTVDVQHEQAPRLKANSSSTPHELAPDLKIAGIRVANLANQNQNLLIGEKKNSCFPVSERRLAESAV